VRLDIPPSLVFAIKFLRGDVEGDAWLGTLPSRIATYARLWNIEPLAIAEGGSMSCCVFCETAEGNQAVLKIPVDASSGRLEARALARWAISGAAPDVYRVSRSSGVFLMARLLPGAIPRTRGDSQEVALYCDLVKRR
jgi:streptomycin 6-kinase